VGIHKEPGKIKRLWNANRPPAAYESQKPGFLKKPGFWLLTGEKLG
jgi:hypothetical protein